MSKEIEGYEEERPDNYERQMMIRYLLGELPDSWQAHFEEILFTDVRCMEQLQLAEDDLIDDYLRGALTLDRRARFETHFLISERRRRKLECAGLLINSVAKYPSQPTAIAADRSINPHLRRRRVTLHPQLMAAAFALIVFGAYLQLWYFKHSVSPANILVKASPQPSQIPPDLNLEAIDKQTRPPSAQRSTQSPDSQSPKAQSGSGLISTQTLFPGRERDAEDRPSERDSRAFFTLPRSKRILRLRLVLAQEDDFHSYNVSLATAEGTAVRLPAIVSTHLSRDKSMITVDIPARPLKNGDYVLILHGVTLNGVSEEIAQYYFRILN